MKSIDKTNVTGLTPEKKEILKKARAVIKKDDPWRDETEWDDYYNELKWLRDKVIQALIDEHGCDEDEAVHIYDWSRLGELLADNSDYVFHYQPEYWARDILKEYQKYREWNMNRIRQEFKQRRESKGKKL